MAEELESTETENQAENVQDEFDLGEDTQDMINAETSEETDEEEQKPEKPINQEAVQKRIDEITFEKYEEKRKREELEKKLADLEEKINKQEAAKEDIVIPDLPDVYDDDYDEKIKARDAAIGKAAEIRARKKIEEDQIKQETSRQWALKQKKILENVEKMYASAPEYGITKEELQVADTRICQFIKDPGLAEFIVSQKDAALIVKYLSSSATELEKISSLNPLDASVYIATKVTTDAKKLKPGVTKAPDPIDIPKGKAKPKTNRFMEGVKLE